MIIPSPTMICSMKPPSMALLRVFAPILRPSERLPWRTPSCRAPKQRQYQQSTQKAAFSNTSHLQARKKGGPRKDIRITQIRYHLYHPLTPRPLRFSRNRALRHWTIHRAWMRYQDKLRHDRELELERQYNSMASACEALRLIDGHGLTAEERLKLAEPRKPSEGKEEGRLYRIAMLKTGIWDEIPIEYARIQTETPSREGWNHSWTR